MSASEASQQANRAGMDPQRLVVISALLIGLVLVLFLGKMTELVFDSLGVANGVLVTGTGITTAGVIGFVLTVALAAYVWFTPRIKTLANEVATELMRVTWPGFEDVRVSTIAVVVASLIAAVILFGMDTLSFKVMVEWLPKLVGAL